MGSLTNNSTPNLIGLKKTKSTTQLTTSGYPKAKSAHSPAARPRTSVPHIVVPEHNHKDLIEILNSGDPDFWLKRGPQGTKVFTSTQEKHDVLINKLKENHVTCFIGGKNNSESNLKKFLVYGLFDFAEEEINEELTARGLPVAVVKRFNSDQQRKRDTFMVCFKASSGVELEHLKSQHKKIFNTLIDWKVFVDKQENIRQCFRCHLFGHGSAYCNAPITCLLCGNVGHDKNGCTLPKLENGKVDPSLLRCALCGGNHTACYSLCPKRLEHIESMRNNQLQVPPANKGMVSKNGKNTDWPELGESSLKRDHPDVAKSKPTTWSSIVKKSNNQIFPDVELWEIFLDFSARLTSCKSRNEQIMTIAELAIKYISPETVHHPIKPPKTVVPNDQTDITSLSFNNNIDLTTSTNHVTSCKSSEDVLPDKSLPNSATRPDGPPELTSAKFPEAIPVPETSDRKVNTPDTEKAKLKLRPRRNNKNAHLSSNPAQ